MEFIKRFTYDDYLKSKSIPVEVSENLVVKAKETIHHNAYETHKVPLSEPANPNINLAEVDANTPEIESKHLDGRELNRYLSLRKIKIVDCPVELPCVDSMGFMDGMQEATGESSLI